MAVARLLGQSFVDSTTMRGFAKLWKAQNWLLRSLWSVYILTMLLLLGTGSYFLIAEYASLYTTLQEGVLVQHASEFPSVAVCSQRPIGARAADLWRSGSVETPRELSRRLRGLVRLAYREGRLEDAKDLFFVDRTSTYFQNVPLRHLANLGVQQSDTILFCLMRHSRTNNPSVSHEEPCDMTVRRLRHPLYGNCFDISVGVATQVSSMSLVLQAGELYRSQVQDVFSQAAGLRVALHEPGTHPNVDADGFSVALGRLTTVKYRLVRHKKLGLGTVASECSLPRSLRRRRIVDFSDSFNYTYSACVSEEIGRVILNTCGCVSAHHLIRRAPNRTHPFCHRIDTNRSSSSSSGSSGSELERRLACMRSVDVPQLVQRLRHCPARCEFLDYQLQVSATVWEPAGWQLRSAIDISAALHRLGCTGRCGNASVDQADEDRLHDFLDIHDFHDDVNDSVAVDRLALLTVSRLSYDTVNKEEAQQVTLSALLSRIGGIGSLTIGCTLAVFFEVVEFVFLFCTRLRQRRPPDAAEVPLRNHGNSAQ